MKLPRSTINNRHWGDSVLGGSATFEIFFILNFSQRWNHWYDNPGCFYCKSKQRTWLIIILMLRRGKNLCINYKLKVVRLGEGRGEERLWPPDEEQQVPDWADLLSVSRQAPSRHNNRPTSLAGRGEYNVWDFFYVPNFCQQMFQISITRLLDYSSKFLGAYQIFQMHSSNF